jgi:hypothetical protein
MLPFPSLSYRAHKKSVISFQSLHNSRDFFREEKTYEDVEDLLELLDLLWCEVLCLDEIITLVYSIASKTSSFIQTTACDGLAAVALL